jgi:hypothetical protein
MQLMELSSINGTFMEVLINVGSLPQLLVEILSLYSLFSPFNLISLFNQINPPSSRESKSLSSLLLTLILITELLVL